MKINSIFIFTLSCIIISIAECKTKPDSEYDVNVKYFSRIHHQSASNYIGVLKMASFCFFFQMAPLFSFENEDVFHRYPF